MAATAAGAENPATAGETAEPSTAVAADEHPAKAGAEHPAEMEESCDPAAESATIDNHFVEPNERDPHSSDNCGWKCRAVQGD